MRSEYRDALMSRGRREAFDHLVAAWSSEMGAISYSETISMMDLFLLTGAIENRMILETLRTRLDSLKARLDVEP